MELQHSWARLIFSHQPSRPVLGTVAVSYKLWPTFRIIRNSHDRDVVSDKIASLSWRKASGFSSLTSSSTVERGLISPYGATSGTIYLIFMTGHLQYQ